MRSARLLKYSAMAVLIIISGNILCTILRVCMPPKLTSREKELVPYRGPMLSEPAVVTYVPTSMEVLHIGVVVLNYSECRYTSLLVKSVLMHRENLLHLHFLTNAKAGKVLKTLIDTWHVPYLNTTFYATEEFSAFNISTTGTEPLKVWLPELVPENVSELVVLEPSVITEMDIAVLWQEFKTMRQEGKSVGVLSNKENGELDTRVLIVNVTAVRGRRLFRSFPNEVLLHRITPSWNLIPHCLIHTSPTKCAEFVNIISENSSISVEHLEHVISYDSYGFRGGDKAQSHIGDTSGVLEWITVSCSEMWKRQSYRVHPYFAHYSYEPSDATDVTLVTQLSMDRLHMFMRLLDLWEGPISAAVYIKDQHMVQVLELLHNTSAFQRTNLALHIVYKKGDILYPINFLRNIAWNYSSTPYIFLNDVDLMPGVQIYSRLKQALKPTHTTNSMYIVPAFETQVKELQLPSHKQLLQQYVSDQQVTPFKWQYHKNAHRPTDYKRWFKATEPYTVEWKEQYEPYIVVQYNTTRYDERFAGYGENKVSHIMELHAQHYQFIVLPDVYVLHYPHKPSRDETRFRGTTSRTITPSITNHYYSCIRQLQNGFRRDLRRKYGHEHHSVSGSQSTEIVLSVVVVMCLFAIVCHYCYSSKE